MSEDQAMTLPPTLTLTEDARRYYLETMGVQCWESLDATVGDAAISNAIVSGAAVNNAASSSAIVIKGDATISADSTNMELLEADIQQCEKCQLHATRKQAITGRGNLSADLMFVLLSPNESDDESGALCSGESFDLLSKMLAAIDIPINDVYITSLLKCSVPARHTVSAGEILHCSDYLKQQLKMVQPKMLIVLGDAAARCMLQKDVALDELRAEINSADLAVGMGDVFYFESVPLFVSYSPHELLQKSENKRKAWSDLQLIQQLMQSLAQKIIEG